MHLPLDMPRQPTDSSCGPTCLHAIYRYYGMESDLDRLIDEIPQVEEGGTQLVHLGQHALRRGLSTRLISYNLRVFDPTWWTLDADELRGKLERRIGFLPSERLVAHHRAYLEYLELGGQLDFFDLHPGTLAQLLAQRVPVIAGLSATYLYHASRELPDGRDDDVAGFPIGHFLVVIGWDAASQEVIVSDPFERNPFNPYGEYHVNVQRFINAVLLGIVTYDANLLLITPGAVRPAPQ